MPGSIADTFTRFPHLGPVLPAMGYSEGQPADLFAPHVDDWVGRKW